VEPVPNPNPPKDFAHPIEAEFARLLDYYRIPWRYEPTTFPLAEAADGAIVEALTPDFYLPPFDLYVELTTRVQSTITRKHRKIRQLAKLYPDVRLRLLNRRQMTSLLYKYGLHGRLPGLIGNPNDV
jgi:bifunctional protein TilS/HprT